MAIDGGVSPGLPRSYLVPKAPVLPIGIEQFNVRLLRGTYKGNRRIITHELNRRSGNCVLSMWGYGMYHIGKVTTFDPMPLLQVEFGPLDYITIADLDATLQPHIGNVSTDDDNMLRLCEFGRSKEIVRV